MTEFDSSRHVAAGNGLIFLAHQLIAAKLNLANGATNIDVSALTALTGHRHGYDLDAWLTWWNEAAAAWPR